MDDRDLYAPDLVSFWRSQAHKKPGALRLLNWFSLGFRADSTF